MTHFKGGSRHLNQVIFRVTVQKGLIPPNTCLLMILVGLKGRLIKNTAFEYHIMLYIAFIFSQAFTGQWFLGHCPEKAQMEKTNCPSFFFISKARYFHYTAFVYPHNDGTTPAKKVFSFWTVALSSKSLQPHILIKSFYINSSVRIHNYAADA